MGANVTTFWRKSENARNFLFHKLPVCVVFGPLLLLNELPRRPPNLRRLTRSAAFLTLHETAAVWSGEHFRRIEEAAPWLHRVGDHVLDFCSCELEQRNGVLQLWPLGYSVEPRWKEVIYWEGRHGCIFPAVWGGLWSGDPLMLFVPAEADWDRVTPDWLHGRRAEVVAWLERDSYHLVATDPPDDDAVLDERRLVMRSRKRR